MAKKNIERLNSIYSFVKNAGYASVNELSKMFDVSISTIKRDLETLDNEGKLKRVSGGVTITRHELDTPTSIVSYANIHTDNKLKIAKMINEVVQDNDSIFFDVGSSCYMAYQHLTKKNTTVFTPSIQILTTENENVAHLYCLEGEAVRPYLVIRGFPLLENLNRINPNKIVFSCMGLNSNYDLIGRVDYDNFILRKLLEMNGEKIIHLDSEKICISNEFCVPGIDKINTLITDDKIEEHHKRNIEEKGVNVIIGK